MPTITIPDFDFSAFYYPELYQALKAYFRVNAPELDSEIDYETHIQFAKGFALIGHLNNTNLDVIANEVLLESLTLRESMIRIFELINVTLASATSSTGTVAIELSSVTTSNLASFILQYSQFATESEIDDTVDFEVTEDLPMDRTDQLTSVFAVETEQNNTDGAVLTASPTQFTSAGAAFGAGDVNKWIEIQVSQNGNASHYKIITVVDPNTIEVAGANFTTETSMTWELYDYSVDHKAAANDVPTEFTPWVDVTKQHYLYIGHSHIQWNQIDIDVGLIASVGMSGHWEYYDPTHSKENPTTVFNIGPNINIGLNVDPLLESGESRPGHVVKVTYNPTGQSETCMSTWTGVYNRIETKGLLGQTSIDDNPLNYMIQADWIPLDNMFDLSGVFNLDGEVTFDWPMTLTQKWQKKDINSVEAYWLRFRQHGIAPTVLPAIKRIQIDQDKQYFILDVTQGLTIENEVLGIGTGVASETFETLQGPVFDDSFLTEVDELNTDVWTEWATVKNFLRSGITDRHFKWSYDDNGKLVLLSGNGKSSRVVPPNASVRSTYRIGGEIDGNVGAGTISDNVSGAKFIAAIGNPMPAVGWSIKEGGDEEDLERMKEAGPAQLANDGKVVNGPTAEYSAINIYRDDDGSKVVYRGFGVEEAFGPKTIQLVVVGSGGSFLDQIQLNDLSDYFNGNKYSIPEIEGVILNNHELTPVNYVPREIDITVQVVGTGITIAQVTNALNDYLKPLAKNDDGDYVHEFGGTLAVVMLDCAIKDISSNIENIIRTVPAVDVNLASKELPIPGTFTITIVES